MNVSAVIVTRGDVDLTPVLDSLPPSWERVVWDNSGSCEGYDPGATQVSRVCLDGEDLAVYGRYEGAQFARNDLIYVQDDDAILAPESFDALLAAWKPGHVVCNMPERFRPNYPDSGLVGFGALFDRDLPERAFSKFALSSHRHGAIAWGADGVDRSFFDRECDAVFTALTPRILVDVPYTDREFASDPSRLWKQPGHGAARAQMLALARQVRDTVPA